MGHIIAVVHRTTDSPARGKLSTYIKEWGEGPEPSKKDIVFAVDEIPIMSVPAAQMTDLLNIIYYHGHGFEVRKWKRWDD